MLSDEVLEKVTERITNRIEQQNAYILEQIGKTIKKMGTLTPTEAQQLGQILKFGGDYDKIKKKIAEITSMNVKDIEKIFKEVARSDYQFAKQFYNYRKIKYIPYAENEALKRQVKAVTNIMIDNYIAKTKAIGFSVKDLKGNMTFKPLKKAYRDIIDEAVLNVSQGKSTFQEQMAKVIKKYAGSGLKTYDYENGRSIRLDSAIRMQMKDTLRELHNEEQKLFGEEFDADGVEISVHLNPAPDHEEAQGKQFSTKKEKNQKLSEWEKLQQEGMATAYDGTEIDMHLELKNGETAEGFRPISMYNCYHYTFAIVLGVSRPAYSDEQLKKIIEDNNKGFEFEGKHYTNYEGTQLQRQLEAKIREQKDIQIMAKASGDDITAGASQQQITILSRKYKKLSEASGLPTKLQRMRVSGYRRDAGIDKTYKNYINSMIVGEYDINNYNSNINTTTNDVVLMPDRRQHIYEDHPEVKKYIKDIPNILENPDKVYRQLNKPDTIWLIKDIDGTRTKMTIKLNTPENIDEYGYKNSIIQFQEFKHSNINNLIKNKKIEELQKK